MAFLLLMQWGGGVPWCWGSWSDKCAGGAGAVVGWCYTRESRVLHDTGCPECAGCNMQQAVFPSMPECGYPAFRTGIQMHSPDASLGQSECPEAANPNAAWVALGIHECCVPASSHHIQMRACGHPGGLVISPPAYARISHRRLGICPSCHPSGPPPPRGSPTAVCYPQWPPGAYGVPQATRSAAKPPGTRVTGRRGVGEAAEKRRGAWFRFAVSGNCAFCFAAFLWE